VIVQRKDRAGTFHLAGQPLAVHEVEPGQIDHPEADAVPFPQQRGGTKGLGQHHRTVAEQHRVLTLGQRHATAPLQAIRRGKPIGHDARNRDETEVTAPRARQAVRDGLAHLFLARGLQHFQPGHAAERRDVAHRLVGVAGSSGKEAGERADVDDLSLLGGVVVDLLVGPGGEKAGERVHHREPALQREPTRLGHHVLLGDTALHEAIGEALREGNEAGIEHEIGVQSHDARVALGVGQQRA
jgi:hypothetical protein